MHKIGSFKNQKGKLNYDRDEQFFSQDDIPDKAKEAKAYIQKVTDPDLLGLRKKEWNSSSSVPKNPIQEETHERKLIKVSAHTGTHHQRAYPARHRALQPRRFQSRALSVKGKSTAPAVAASRRLWSEQMRSVHRPLCADRPLSADPQPHGLLETG